MKKRLFAPQSSSLQCLPSPLLMDRDLNNNLDLGECQAYSSVFLLLSLQSVNSPHQDVFTLLHFHSLMWIQQLCRFLWGLLLASYLCRQILKVGVVASQAPSN